jgi:hypothetical protein
VDLSTGDGQILDPGISGGRSKECSVLRTMVVNDEVLSLVRTKKGTHLVRFDRRGGQKSCFNLTQDLVQRLLTASITASKASTRFFGPNTMSTPALMLLTAASALEY